MYKRKLFRITRKRVSRRIRSAWKQHRYRFYVRFINNIAPRNKVVYRKNLFRINKIYNKYISFPFFNQIEPKKFHLMIKKWKRIHNRGGHNVFIQNYENWLYILAYRLNFAPNFYWARVITRMGWISVSNVQHPSVKLDKVKFLWDRNPVENKVPGFLWNY